MSRSKNDAGLEISGESLAAGHHIHRSPCRLARGLGIAADRDVVMLDLLEDQLDRIQLSEAIEGLPDTIIGIGLYKETPV